MKTLVLMRHGQTLFNEKHRIQGWCDAPLTPLGIAQAQHAARFVHGLGLEFDYLVSSPSERACDTLELVFPEGSYDRNKGIKEINFGRFEGEPEILNPPVSQYTPFFTAAGGEGREQAGERMMQTLTAIMDDPAHHTVFAASHGGAMMNFAHMCACKEGINLHTRFENCCVLVLDYDPEARTFTIREFFNEPYTQQDFQQEQQAQQQEVPA